MQRSARGCRPLRVSKLRSGIARPTPSYGSTHQAGTITLRATLGTVTRSAVLTSAKLRPTKTACAQVQNERFWADRSRRFGRGAFKSALDVSLWIPADLVDMRSLNRLTGGSLIA